MRIEECSSSSPNSQSRKSSKGPANTNVKANINFSIMTLQNAIRQSSLGHKYEAKLDRLLSKVERSTNMSFARPTTMTNAQAAAAQGSTMSAIYQHGFMPASSLQPSSLMKTVSRQSSMNSSFMGEHPDAKNVEKLIASKLRTQQMAHEQLIMYAKNSAIADALIYVKNKCHEIEELLTSQKTDIINKYEAFQKHNINLLKENHIIHEKWKAAEFASIYINPLSEYNYGVDKNTPLKKFNFITPSIGEHLKILADQKQKEYNEKLKKENTALRAANEQLQEQLDTLVFWEDIMEQGVDARDLIVEFGNLQNEHRKLLNTSG